MSPGDMVEVRRWAPSYTEAMIEFIDAVRIPEIWDGWQTYPVRHLNNSLNIHKNGPDGWIAAWNVEILEGIESGKSGIAEDK